MEYLGSRYGLIVPSAIDQNSRKVRSNCISSEFLEKSLLVCYFSYRKHWQYMQYVTYLKISIIGKLIKIAGNRKLVDIR